MDSNADGNVVAMDDVWKIENRRRAHADDRRQGTWNEELEKHDGGTKNRMIGGWGVDLGEFVVGVCCICGQAV